MLLRYSADRRTLAVVITYFLLLFVGFMLPLSWSVTPFFMGLLCLVSFVCAVITHNTVHAPIFWSKRLNQLMQVVLTLTYGHPVSAFVPGHNLSHHRFTQTQRDLMRTSKVNYRWNWLNQLLFAWSVGPAIFMANARFATHMRNNKPKWFRQLMLETAVYILMVVASILIDWQKAILLVMIPHQYAAWGIMGINFIQHDGCDRDSPWNHSRNFTGQLVNWITFNNGYHGIHHMKPSLHWSLLPETHSRELAPNIHPSLDQANFPLYLFKTFVYPGVRTRFTGEKYSPPPVGEDEEWIPQNTSLQVSDLGAIS